MKTGGLRLFMTFYLMGMQNTPNSNSSKADQPMKNTSENYNIDSNNEGAQPEEVLDFYYHDRTPMLSIVLSESQITIKRIGSTPLTSYLCILCIFYREKLQICSHKKSEDFSLKCGMAFDYHINISVTLKL